VPLISEKLGYIEHIFSSKNGVLTENSLVFKMCAVGEKIYGAEETFTDKKTTVNHVNNFAFRDP
jgi:magnesium-transporting ATPase (P-type)